MKRIWKLRGKTYNVADFTYYWNGVLLMVKNPDNTLGNIIPKKYINNIMFSYPIITKRATALETFPATVQLDRKGNDMVILIAKEEEK